MKERASLKILAVNARDKANGKQSVLKRLKQAEAKLTDEMVVQLVRPVSNATKPIEELAARLDALIEELDKARPLSFPDTRARVEALIKDLGEKDSEGTEDLDAMEYLLSEDRRAVKHVKNQTRYSRVKTQNKLTNGGFRKAYAKELVVRMENPDNESTKIARDPTHFDASKIQIWSPSEDEDKTSGVMKVWANFQKGLPDLDADIVSLRDALQDNPNWKCAMKRVDAPTKLDASDEHVKLEVYDDDDHGCFPWLLASRLAMWRWGPCSVVSPGYGQFVRTVGNSSDACAVLFPARSVLSHGIPMKDFPTFTETPSCAEMMKEESLVVKVQQE